jgi:Fe2+ or Zn2+ uptake regulation protein
MPKMYLQCTSCGEVFELAADNIVPIRKHWCNDELDTHSHCFELQNEEEAF